MLAVEGLFNRVISETDQGFVGSIIPWTLAGLLAAGDRRLTVLLGGYFRLPRSESTDLAGVHTIVYRRLIPRF